MNSPAENLSNTTSQRLVRFNEMVPCKTAFIDARTPGSDKKENFCLIGQGVAENPDQVVHIEIPHGFNIGAARQPHGCKNSHHSHDTEEVFMIHSGDWRFTWGKNGDDGSVVLHAGDIISLPPHMFRGFENVGDDDAIMFSILGLDDSGTAGHVLWAPYVFEQAKHHGLVLLEDGRLIDTAAGVKIPTDGKEILATTDAQADALDKYSVADMAKCVALQSDLNNYDRGGLSALDGVEEIAIIGVANEHENIGAGRMAWPHGFHLRRLQIDPGASIPNHKRFEEEVIIVHQGQLDISTPEAEFTLRAGDLFTVPIESPRAYTNSGSEIADLFVVRRRNHPQAAEFLASH